MYDANRELKVVIGSGGMGPKMLPAELRILEAIELCCLLLVGADLNDVHAKTGVSKNTLRRWRDEGVKRPGLLTFTNIAAYFDIKVSVKDLRVATDPKRRSIHNILG